MQETEEKADIERRRYPRIPYGAWIEDLTLEGAIQFYLAQNLSLGGLLLQSDAPPPIGHRLHLRLVVENESRVMSMDGEVVRHTTLDSGARAFAVTFINLDEDRRDFLQELIRECWNRNETSQR